MKEKYTKVPNIITGKDLDYLSDMFNWNYLAYKKTFDFKNHITDEEIKEIFTKSTNIFHSNISKILNILNNGGTNE